MKLRKLIQVLHPDTLVAIIDNDNDIKVVRVSELDKVLKERQAKRLYPATSDNPYDFYIELSSWSYIKMEMVILEHVGD